MMKSYLVTRSDHYYPCSGTGDWLEFFETEEEALGYIKKLNETETEDMCFSFHIINLRELQKEEPDRSKTDMEYQWCSVDGLTLMYQKT